jgi:polyisoprenoid-binding protein YceI
MSLTGRLTASSLRAALSEGEFAGSWTLEPARSEVRLSSRAMWGLAPVKGVFRQVTGGGTVSPSGEVTGMITVAAGSVDTRNRKRDDHLRSSDFFDVANYPDLTFTVGSVEASDVGAKVTGAFTVRGQTRPVTLDAKLTGGDGGELLLDGEIHVNRAEFGLK